MKTTREGTSIFKRPPIRRPNALPDPRRNSFGKITKLHLHPYGDVTLNFNNLATGYMSSFNRS
jgi:hypothetical protein